MSGIKKIVVFGATGNTGLATIETGLKKGYEVTAFVRDPKKLPENITPTNVVVGDVLDKDDVEKAIKNQDAVVVVLGTRSDLSATIVMSEGTQSIVDVMKDQNIKRISCCLSSFLFWDRNKIPERLLNIHLDHVRMLEVLKASDREWIGVCPPHIEDSPPRGDYTLKNDGAVGRSISKYDLAAILIDSLTDDERVGHLVGMGYPSA